MSVGTQRAFINTEYIEFERWDRRWLMRTGVPSAQHCTKELKERIGRAVLSLQRMSEATGAKKLSESQKSESFSSNESDLGQG